MILFDMNKILKYQFMLIRQWMENTIWKSRRNQSSFSKTNNFTWKKYWSSQRRTKNWYLKRNDENKMFQTFFVFSKNTCSKSRCEWSQIFFFIFFCFYIYLNFKVNPEVLGVIENEKKNLLSQLRDYEWRLEQENKVIYLYSSR